MDYKDYYKILGVPKTAPEKEIKSAYRKLARKYHPDVNPGDKDAEKRFKEINEAQAVLTDPEKRKKYDTLGPDWEKRLRPQGTRSAGQPYAGTGDIGDFSDFFETLFGRQGGAQQQGAGFDFDLGSIFGRGRGKRAAAQRGSDLDQPIDVTLQEAYAGAERSFTVQTAVTCPTCGGTGIQNDRVCPTCSGSGTVPKTRRLHVKIPAGVKDGSRIRVAGEGNPGHSGGNSGDLFLVVHVLPDANFRREGDNLYADVQVPLTTLVLGGEIEIPTMTGRVTMKIPANSQNGRTMRLGGQGMPQLKGGGRGDLYVKLNALLPTALNEKQRELFQELARAGV